jgi:cysteinyl-tRNA synthetase
MPDTDTAETVRLREQVKILHDLNHNQYRTIESLKQSRREVSRLLDDFETANALGTVPEWVTQIRATLDGAS